MRPFAIVTDSTCDLDPAVLAARRIDYAHMNYTIGQEEYPALPDWQAHSSKAFYDLMREGTRIQTTQVPRAVFESVFRAHLEAGEDVLYVACSSALSGSVKLARLIADELAPSFPEGRIRCVDTLISSLGEGYLAQVAADWRDEGRSLDETADHLEAIRLTVHQFGTVNSLEYLRRAGRVTASSAFFGNLFGVKPILISDRIGQNYAVKKVKGARNARAEIAAMVAEAVVEPEKQTLWLSHADAEEEILALRDEILARVPFKDCYINVIAPIVGASTGPGTVIAFCVGKEVTVEGGKD